MASIFLLVLSTHMQRRLLVAGVSRIVRFKMRNTNVTNKQYFSQSNSNIGYKAVAGCRLVFSTQETLDLPQFRTKHRRLTERRFRIFNSPTRRLTLKLAWLCTWAIQMAANVRSSQGTPWKDHSKSLHKRLRVTQEVDALAHTASVWVTYKSVSIIQSIRTQ